MTSLKILYLHTGLTKGGAGILIFDGNLHNGQNLCCLPIIHRTCHVHGVLFLCAVTLKPI